MKPILAIFAARSAPFVIALLPCDFVDRLRDRRRALLAPLAAPKAERGQGVLRSLWRSRHAGGCACSHPRCAARVADKSGVSVGVSTAIKHDHGPLTSSEQTPCPPTLGRL